MRVREGDKMNLNSFAKNNKIESKLKGKLVWLNSDYELGWAARTKNKNCVNYIYTFILLELFLMQQI